MSSLGNSFMDIISMNRGDGEHSYDVNSRHQRNAISRTQPKVEESMREMLHKLNYPKCIKVADLGCSSGQNTLVVMFQIVNTIIGSYQLISQNPLEIDYCLNDLPENDFNATFKLIPSFNKEVKAKCLVSGIPGSFYTRLFPKKSLHFLYSSFSIHWLSKVPQGLEDNKKNIYIRSGCSLNVCKSYMNQFRDDFSLFFRLRSEEMLPNGCMVLAFVGKNDSDPLSKDSNFLWALLSDALNELVLERVMKESEVESFNLPFYKANEGEVREIVVKEGSFKINKIETYELLVSLKNDEDREEADEKYGEQFLGIEAGKKLANIIRSITETMLVSHFGDANNIINHLFDKCAHLASQYTMKFHRFTTVNFIISLIRK